MKSCLCSESELPIYLERTRDLLKRAYPEAPVADEYVALLALLSPHFSSRNLAIAIEHAFGFSYASALHDVYSSHSKQMDISSEVSEAVLQQLREAGYDEWLDGMK